MLELTSERNHKMPRKSSQKLNLKRYMKEEMVVIPVKVTHSQHDLLMTMAKGTNQALPELVALLLTDWVMPGVEEAIQDSQIPTGAIAGAPTAENPSKERPTNENGNQKIEAPPLAAPVDPSARQPVANPPVNDPPGSETPRGQQPTNPNFSRPPQVPTTPHSAVPLASPANRGEPLPPTSRPVMPPSAKPSSGDAGWPESAADSSPKT